MSENTKIEWATHTFNPWEGCQKVGPGCDHCYAETRNARYAGGTAINWGPGAPRRRTSASNWAKPLAWNANHEEFFEMNGYRQRVFCASLADVFDNEVDPQWRMDLFSLIAKTPNLDWLLLTKRIGNVKKMSSADSLMFEMIESRVWLGATIVNQEEADRDIPKLLAVPAARRFLSMEPLLGEVNLTAIPMGGSGHHEFDPIITANVLRRAEAYPPLPSIDWVIVGGESGPGARPMHPDWARSLRDQCAAADVPFLFKQWGEWHTAAVIASNGEAVFRQFDSHQQWVNKASTWVQGGICLDRHGSEMKSGGDMQRASDAGAFPVTIMHKVGKKSAGRLLDGRKHDGLPESAA